MSDITISYKGSSIATMDATGTKTLLTEGKYCEDDITIDYVKSGGGGGGNTYTKTTYTIVSEASINQVFNNANIPLSAQDEILIWNIKGTNQQDGGSVGGKWGIIIVQSGQIMKSVSNTDGSFYQRMESVAAPNSAVPGYNSWWTPTIEDGHYKAENTTNFRVAGGNTVDFIQMPYSIGWSTS